MSNRDQDTGSALAQGGGLVEVASGRDGEPRNPVLAALEAYRRAHPHREDEIDAAFATFDPDQASEVVEVAPAAPSGPEPAPTSEHLFDDHEWASEHDREEMWWQRM